MRILQDGSRYLILDVTHDDIAALWRVLPHGAPIPGSHQRWNKLVDPIMGKPEITIPADVRTDDHQHLAEFDAVAWFQYVDDAAVINLAKCGWGGDYPADDVAALCSEHNNDVASVLAAAEGMEGDGGFECHVNKERALAWLEENRHGLFCDLLEKELTV